MSAFSNDEMDQFRLESDRAFLQMQQNADKAMAEFMQLYGGEGMGVEPSKPSIFSAQTTLAPQGSSLPRSGTQKIYGSTPGLDLGGMHKSRLTDSVQDLQNDYDAISRNLRQESKAAAQDALKGTSDILKQSATGLGQKAKEEAAALREAMKQAMQEERSLKAMQGRAAEEARKAKERFAQNLQEAKAEAVDNLQDLAQGHLESLRGKAGKAFEQGQESVEREWEDFTSGQDRN